MLSILLNVCCQDNLICLPHKLHALLFFFFTQTHTLTHTLSLFPSPKPHSFILSNTNPHMLPTHPHTHSHILSLIQLHCNPQQYVVYLDKQMGTAHLVHWLKYALSHFKAFCHILVRNEKNDTKACRKCYFQMLVVYNQMLF